MKGLAWLLLLVETVTEPKPTRLENAALLEQERELTLAQSDLLRKGELKLTDPDLGGRL